MIKYAKLKQLNKTLVSTSLATGLFASAFVGYSYLPRFQTEIHADSYLWEDVSSEMCSNYNFASSGVDDVWSPSNFTAIDPNNIGNNTDLLIAGVIDCTANDIEDYQKTYGLSEQEILNTNLGTSTTDSGISHHLMINGMNNNTKYGYKTADFTLEANSYYEISVYAKVTSDNGGFGTIVLDGLSNENQSSSIRITNTSWDTYTFFVATGANKTETVNLQLWLGSETETSTDAIFYNKINMKRYSQSAFENNPNKDTSNKTLYIDLEQYEEVALFDNQDFSKDLSIGWNPILTDTTSSANTICQVYEVKNDYDKTLEQLGIEKPFTINNNDQNTTALLMYNAESTTQGIESDDFYVERDKVYRLSVWAKSNCGAEQGATINIVEQNATEGEPLVVSQTVATSVTTNDSFSDWTQYNFYIKGNPYHNSVLKIQLLLGTSETPTNGYVWFDEITMQQVTYTEYNAPLGTYQTVNLDKNATDTILNGNFSSVNNDTTSNVGPLDPANWTLSTVDTDFDLEDSMSGVIATRSDLFLSTVTNLSTKPGFTTINNPGLTPTDSVSTINTTKNKVLMIGNGSNKMTQTYTSDEFTLESGKFYRMSFLVQTQGVINGEDSGVTLKVKSGEKTIYQYSGIASESTWDSYALYLSTQGESATYTIELTLENTTGYAFFDNVYLNTFDDSTKLDLDYDNNDTYLHKYKVDQTKNTFDNYVQNDTIFDGYYDPFDWTLKVEEDPEEATIQAGVTKKNDENVLAIEANRDVYATYTYDNAYSFSSGSFYKLSITLRTEGLGQLEGLTEYDEDHNAYPYGIYVTLSDIGTFEAINTQNEIGNGYKTYTFYVATKDTTSSTLSIAMGSEHALTYGNVYVQSIELETIADQDTFESETNNLDSNYNIVVNTAEAKDDTEDTTDTTNTGNNDMRLDLVIPSVLLALAVLIALIGTLLRRMKLHRKPKVQTTYDRRKTIELQMNKQERINLRKTIIEDLNTELLSIDQEIEQLKKEFDLLTSQSREEHTRLIESFRVEKESLQEQHQDLVKEYKEKLKSLDNEEDRAKAERQFAKYVRKLQDREEILSKKMEIKDEKTALLTQKRDAQLKKHLERKLLIEQEIQQVELEIEAIAREEEEMWSEYRKAKEQEKQEKLLYVAEKRKYKQRKKLERQNAKNTLLTNKEDTTDTQSTTTADHEKEDNDQPVEKKTKTQSKGKDDSSTTKK